MLLFGRPATENLHGGEVCRLASPRYARAVLRLVLAAMLAAAALAACGGDGDAEPGSTTGAAAPTTAPEQTEPPGATEDPAPPTQPPQPPSPPPAEPPATSDEPQSCPDVAFSPNSGDGAFEIEVTGLSCAEAERLLRSETGLQSYDCEEEALPAGNQRFTCDGDGGTLSFETGI